MNTKSNASAKRNTDKKTKIKKEIYGDALYSMRIPILLHTAVACAEGILAVFTATVLGQFADSVFQLDFALGMESALSLGLALCGMILFLPALTLLANVFMLKYALVHDRMVLGRFLDKTYDSVLPYEPGDIQNRLDWDPTRLRCDLVEYINKGLMMPVTLAFLLFHALELSPVYTAAVFGISLLKLLIPLAVRKLEGRCEQETREYTSARRSLEAEITQNPCMVKLYGLGEAFGGKADRLYQDFFRQTQKTSIRLSAGAQALSSFTGTFCLLAILLSGSLLAAKGFITPGTVASMYGYSAVFNTLFENTGFLLRDLPVLRNTADRLSMFYENAEENSERIMEQSDKSTQNNITSKTIREYVHKFVKNVSTGTTKSTSTRTAKNTSTGTAKNALTGTAKNASTGTAKNASTGTIKNVSIETMKNAAGKAAIPTDGTSNDRKQITQLDCQNLSYAYGGQQALPRISFSLRPGGKTALCGPNGSGKSTLLKVMACLLTNYNGKLLVNGRELREWDTWAYRSHIAYAPQEPYLFQGSVLENIKIGNPSLSDAAAQALIEKMGIGYLAHTPISPGNSGLSGGEKQKISIARAVASDRPFLFLDEPGNHLDGDTLDWLCAFLRKSSKTIVFVSHHERLAACADRQIWLG